jgi:alpha-amylase/alpha-mannosidase (GH57 family)
VPDVYHLLGLHMHQPPGNLQYLLNNYEWEARQIMLCYERPLKYAERYRDVARFCIGFSGILLEQLQDPAIVSCYAGIVDIPKMLESYRKASNIELVGMGYYHPIFPLIPVEDWDDQLERGKQKVVEIFGREPKIFWPSEMAFSKEMIPALVRRGYQYVVIDSVHVEPVGPRSREETLYQSQFAEYEGSKITVLPRDRDLSNAQQSGLNPSWFEGEVRSKTAGASKDCLVTTWTDGENGGWFRQIDEGAGFWGYFFAPYMERVRAGQIPMRPVPVSEFVSKNPPVGKVEVQTGAWNVGTTTGYDFSQWTGSSSQRKALEEIWLLSKSYHELSQSPRKGPWAADARLKRVRESILKAETSCYLFWGDAWIPKLYEETRVAHQLLSELKSVARISG